jgi:UDP-glucose 4-epimerase
MKNNLIKILITGGAGNIGSALADKLISSGSFNVCVVDNLSTGKYQKISKLLDSPNFEFVKADVNDFNAISTIMTTRSFDFVFHFAAVVGVQRTLESPLTVLLDVQGIKNILELSKNTFVKRVFYSSSSEVYGEPVEFPQNEETTPLNSKLPYAIVKNIGEAYFKSYQKEYGLDYTIFRFFNTYGPNQSDDFVVPKFIELAKKNQPITLYGGGVQSRTFCYVDDNVDTILNILLNDICINDIINIGSDVEITILELAKLIINITNSNSILLELPALLEGDMTRRLPDISKMKTILNRELININTGVNRMLV